jgi:hypothetical protein
LCFYAVFLMWHLLIKVSFPLLGVEMLRASCLVCRCSTTWVRPSALLVSF